MANPSKQQQDAADAVRRTAASSGPPPWSPWPSWRGWRGPEGEPEDRVGAADAFGLHDDPYPGNASASVVLVGYESPHRSSCPSDSSGGMTWMRVMRRGRWRGWRELGMVRAG